MMVKISTLRRNKKQEHRNRTDPYYLSKTHKTFRKVVFDNAKGLCEDCLDPKILNMSGTYGELITPGDVADHVIPRNAGGSDNPHTNGRCLCNGHHARKSNQDKKYYR